ncbi:hypothetical protein RHMOL_Rhmol08G0131200 [Rhododendron molle]|uniref:Uncharacterized protein n=1 Tax=Rhododendron molle TaxID=49168 RepID=A0ACC0MPA4_RHOML|nr:hypothetical protein RHMOL_Rhmol08G0131200 [Rhododendron molle]
MLEFEQLWAYEVLRMYPPQCKHPDLSTLPRALIWSKKNMGPKEGRGSLNAYRLYLDELEPLRSIGTRGALQEQSLSTWPGAGPLLPAGCFLSRPLAGSGTSETGCRASHLATQCSRCQGHFRPEPHTRAPTPRLS